jgi:hypothetical protein
MITLYTPILPTILVQVDAHFRAYHKRRALKSANIESAEQFILEMENKIVEKLGRPLKLNIYGSLMSGFGTKDSDLDLCIEFLDGTVVEAVGILLMTIE